MERQRVIHRLRESQGASALDYPESSPPDAAGYAESSPGDYAEGFNLGEHWTCRHASVADLRELEGMRGTIKTGADLREVIGESADYLEIDWCRFTPLHVRGFIAAALKLWTSVAADVERETEGEDEVPPAA
jgi:hypothetical protein